MRKLPAVVLCLMLFAPVAFAKSSSSSSKSSAAPTVLPFEAMESNIAYLRIGTFTKNVAKLIRPTMQAINNAHPRALIVDLRDNQGGDVGVVDEFLNTVLPQNTPYMRVVSTYSKKLQVTSQKPIINKSLPIVVLRNAYTVNEPDILIYILAKIRNAGVVEFSPGRAALKRAYKQHSDMDQYRPIKEGIFFVTPDSRVIGSEGATEEDVIPWAISLAKQMSPWDEPKR